MKRRGGRVTSRAVTIEAWIFIAVLVASVWAYQAGLIAELTAWVSALGPLVGGLIAGGAYSTFVTTPFSVAELIQMGSDHAFPIWQIALSGALGATIVDLLLVRGVRSPLALLLVRAVVGHDTELFKSKIKRKPMLRWCAALFGGFLMAAPLPTDELGVVFFGASGLSAVQMIPIIFISDFTGIYAVLSAARAFSGT